MAMEFCASLLVASQLKRALSPGEALQDEPMESKLKACLELSA